MGGRGRVRLVTTATPLTSGKTEDDFPAAAYGPDGTLWVAYISYHLRDESRRIEQKQLQGAARPISRRVYTPSSPINFSSSISAMANGARQWPSRDRRKIWCRAISGECRQTALVAYSANRNGRHDIYARLDRREARQGAKADRVARVMRRPLTSAPYCVRDNPEIFHLPLSSGPRMARAACFHLNGLSLQENGWSSRFSGSSGLAGGGEWNVATCRRPRGCVANRLRWVQARRL